MSMIKYFHTSSHLQCKSVCAAHSSSMCLLPAIWISIGTGVVTKHFMFLALLFHKKEEYRATICSFWHSDKLLESMEWKYNSGWLAFSLPVVLGMMTNAHYRNSNLFTSHPTKSTQSKKCRLPVQFLVLGKKQQFYFTPRLSLTSSFIWVLPLCSSFCATPVLWRDGWKHIYTARHVASRQGLFFAHTGFYYLCFR